MYHYIKKTADVTFHIRKGSKEVNINVNTDWAGNIEDRNSTSGYIIK